jgi:hypothetical protein
MGRWEKPLPKNPSVFEDTERILPWPAENGTHKDNS